jgi:hypothetical protein
LLTIKLAKPIGPRCNEQVAGMALRRGRAGRPSLVMRHRSFASLRLVLAAGRSPWTVGPTACGSTAGRGAAPLAPLHGSRQAGHGGVSRELPAGFVTHVPLVMALVRSNERGWLRSPPSCDQALGFACSEQESRSTTKNASTTTPSGGCLVTHDPIGRAAPNSFSEHAQVHEGRPAGVVASVAMRRTTGSRLVPRSAVRNTAATRCWRSRTMVEGTTLRG